jgi:hypothetical protein
LPSPNSGLLSLLLQSLDGQPLVVEPGFPSPPR